MPSLLLLSEIKAVEAGELIDRSRVLSRRYGEIWRGARRCDGSHESVGGEAADVFTPITSYMMMSRIKLWASMLVNRSRVAGRPARVGETRGEQTRATCLILVARFRARSWHEKA